MIRQAVKFIYFCVNHLRSDQNELIGYKNPALIWFRRRCKAKAKILYKSNCDHLEKSWLLLILALHDNGHGRRYMLQNLGISLYQVWYTIEKGIDSLKKNQRLFIETHLR